MDQTINNSLGPKRLIACPPEKFRFFPGLYPGVTRRARPLVSGYMTFQVAIQVAIYMKSAIDCRMGAGLRKNRGKELLPK